MQVLNARQRELLRALTEQSAGLPRADVDGRVLRALSRHGLAEEAGGQVRATAEGIRAVGGEPKPDRVAESLSNITVAEPIALPTTGSQPKIEVTTPADMDQRVQRLKRLYERVEGEVATAPGNMDYGLNIAFLVADALEQQGIGRDACGEQLWAELLRVTNYHEQKKAQQTARTNGGQPHPATHPVPRVQNERTRPKRKLKPGAGPRKGPHRGHPRG